MLKITNYHYLNFFKKKLASDLMIFDHHLFLVIEKVSVGIRHSFISSRAANLIRQHET